MTLPAVDHALGAFWIEVLRHVWQSLLVLAALFLIAPILRSAPTRWSHRLWLAALAKLFVPLAVFGPLTAALIQRVWASAAPSAHANALSGFRVAVTVLGIEARPALVARIPAPFWTLFTIAYAAVATVLLVHTVRDLASARRLRLASAEITGEHRRSLDAAIARAGLSRERIVVTQAPIIPAVVGTFHPRLVIPVPLIDTLETDELAAVLLHEEMHRRHGDPAIALVQRLTSSLLFFVPLLAPLQRRLLEAAELRCDEGALRAGAAPAAYARALARTIQLGLDPSPAPAALGDGNPSLVARRLARLREPWRTKVMTTHRIAIVFASIVLAAGMLFPVGPTKALAGFEPSGAANLDRLAAKDQRITVKFEDTPAADVLAAIAAAGNIKLSVDGPLDCCAITLELKDVPLFKALAAVAGGAEVGYEVLDANHLHATLSGTSAPTKDMTMPKIVNKVEPIYPQDARDAKATGFVVLKAVVRDDGTVANVEVLRHVEGWPSLDDAAVAAVRQWTYTPAMKDGHPVSVLYHVKVDFRLE